MATKPSARQLDELLDERVHLLIRINLIENGKPARAGVMPLLQRRLASTEQEIETVRRALASGWQANAFMTGGLR